jgi:hypothetical protein
MPLTLYSRRGGASQNLSRDVYILPKLFTFENYQQMWQVVHLLPRCITLRFGGVLGLIPPRWPSACWWGTPEPRLLIGRVYRVQVRLAWVPKILMGTPYTRRGRPMSSSGRLSAEMMITINERPWSSYNIILNVLRTESQVSSNIILLLDQRLLRPKWIWLSIFVEFNN